MNIKRKMQRRYALNPARYWRNWNKYPPGHKSRGRLMGAWAEALINLTNGNGVRNAPGRFCMGRDMYRGTLERIRDRVKKLQPLP